jgi:soluble P-type ATPase
MDFEIVGDLSDVEIIAIGSGISDIARLRRVDGRGRW